MPRILLIAAGVAALIIIYFSIQSKNTVSSTPDLNTQQTQPATAATPTPNQQGLQNENPVAPLSSEEIFKLSEVLKQSVCPKNFSGSIFSLTEAELRNELKAISNFQEELHWENYHYSQDGVKYILHLVPADTESGFEKWVLKKFKDEDDGPSFVSEKTYNTQSLARNELNKLISFEAKKSKKLSWSDKSGLSLSASLAEKVFDLKIETSNYTLLCEQSSCRCF